VKEKEVIIPSFTFIATANAVVLAGGIPVFAETEAETYGLDAEDVESRITEKTAAILNLDFGGFPARDHEKLREIADRHNILYIGDSAESLGSKTKGKLLGSIADSTIFSFCQNKVVSTGEGGVLITNDESVYEKSKLIRSHGRVELAEDYFSSTEDNDYIQIGYNYRMPTMCAALGLSQMKKISENIKMRRSNADFLNEGLGKIEQVKTPTLIEGDFQVYQMYTIQLPNQETRDALQSHLTEQGISTKVYFNPVHLKTVYKNMGCSEGDLPKTETLSGKVLTLPMHPSLTEAEMEYIINSVEDFFKNVEA
ncbi:MAG: DegT/DnrJ/EryC1/StrS family aminotransferase, partial [archaeon]|nr:DegT/DnrJ/EryC1/StrS family aminotransferase [archaeon]